MRRLAKTDETVCGPYSRCAAQSLTPAFRHGRSTACEWAATGQMSHHLHHRLDVHVTWTNSFGDGAADSASYLDWVAYVACSSAGVEVA